MPLKDQPFAPGYPEEKPSRLEVKPSAFGPTMTLKEVVAVVMEGWDELPQLPVWKSARVVIELLNDHPDKFEKLRFGLRVWYGCRDLPTSRWLAIKLRAIKGRVLNGRSLAAKAYQGTLQWRVVGEEIS